MQAAGFLTKSLHQTFGLMIEAGDCTSVDKLPATEFIQLFKQHGALLLRDFKVDTETFLNFTSLYTREFSTYQGGGLRWGQLDRKQIDGHETLLSVTGSTQSFAVPLHGEMYYMRRKPGILWFYCAHPPEQAGETTLCDGIKLHESMSEDLKAFFARNRLKYVRQLTAEEWPVVFQTNELPVLRKWCAENGAELTVEDDNSILVEYVCSATSKNGEADVFINNLLIVYSAEQAIRTGVAQQVLGSLPRNVCPMVVRLESGAEVPEEVVAEIRKTAESLTYNVSWRQDDILMVDNTRVLHGRKRCEGQGRSIYVRMGEPAFASQP